MGSIRQYYPRHNITSICGTPTTLMSYLSSDMRALYLTEKKMPFTW